MLTYEYHRLPLSTYPSVGKLLWLLETEPKVQAAYEKGVLAFGTIDTWLVYKLNGGGKRLSKQEHPGDLLTDFSWLKVPNATSSSRTLRTRRALCL